ncbi:MAG: DUF3826 domain-containing protein [Opitutaceae bacterium]|nr:DUF3826 domain-containing protein [Opitutaceae bacterium]
MSLVLRLLLICLALGLSAGLRAESSVPPRAVLEQRATKIATSLKLADPAKTTRVATLIANQYESLARIHALRDEKVKAAKTSASNDKAGSESSISAARNEATASQDQLHASYLAALATELSPTEIDQVKDGMTYGVLPLTFRVYQEMLPHLTAEQKAQIHAWLVEAREHAMDASTSEEKHGWFGKYKGRINNYLSAAGIDMKQAERDLAARRKAAESK